MKFMQTRSMKSQTNMQYLLHQRYHSIIHNTLILIYAMSYTVSLFPGSLIYSVSLNDQPGMSKDFASGGARIGCIYVRNKELKKAMEAINNFHWSGGPNQQVAVTILEDLEWSTKFMQKGRESLAARNKLARQILDDAGIK